MINAVIELVIVLFILAILYLLVTKIPAEMDLVKKVLTWVLILVGALFLIDFLLGLTGKGFINFGHGPAMDRVEEKQSSV